MSQITIDEIIDAYVNTVSETPLEKMRLRADARRALAAHTRSACEKTWDDAYQAGAYDTLRSPRDARENPFREKTKR